MDEQTRKDVGAAALVVRDEAYRCGASETATRRTLLALADRLARLADTIEQRDAVLDRTLIDDLEWLLGQRGFGHKHALTDDRWKELVAKIGNDPRERKNPDCYDCGPSYDHPFPHVYGDGRTVADESHATWERWRSALDRLRASREGSEQRDAVIEAAEAWRKDREALFDDWYHTSEDLALMEAVDALRATRPAGDQ